MIQFDLKGVICALALLAGACASPPRPFQVPEGQYGQELLKVTRSVSIYQQLDASLFAYATDETSEFKHARAERLAQVFRVPVEEAEKHGGDVTERFPEAHVFFLAVNTNDRNANDLERPSSQWSITLETKTETFRPAAVIRENAKVTAIQAIYPFVDRFFVTYRVLFPNTVGNGPYTLVISGPLGEGRMTFTGEGNAPPPPVGSPVQ